MNIANETVGSAVADGGSPAGSPGAPCRGAPVGAPAGGELPKIKRPPPYDFPISLLSPDFLGRFLVVFFRAWELSSTS